MKYTTEKRASPSFYLYSKLSQINKPNKQTKEDFMFTKLKQVIEPNRFSKYMERKELSPNLKQQWLRDNTPATPAIQSCISDLKYLGLDNV